MLNIALHSCARGSAAETYPLDGVSNIWSARSFRRLLTSWTGNIGRVRRDTDSAEADFNDVKWTDGTLAEWVGVGNNGYLVTQYDQSGNGRNWTQSTASSQPLVVENGVVILGDGVPAHKQARLSDLLELSTGGALPSDLFLSVIFLNTTEQRFIVYDESGSGQYIGYASPGDPGNHSPGVGSPVFFQNGLDFPGTTRDQFYQGFQGSKVIMSAEKLNLSAFPDIAYGYYGNIFGTEFCFEEVWIEGTPTDAERNQIFGSQKDYAGIA